MTPDDARDLQIHHHLERMVYVLCSMRGVSKQKLYRDMLSYMRGEAGLSASFAISNAFQCICESPSIKPPISMPDLFERVEAFIENDDGVVRPPSPVPSPTSNLEGCKPGS